MPKLHTLQTSFITGQLDEAAQARSETALYRNGARGLRNCWPYVTGGVASRPGTWHRANLPGPAILAEFAFSLSQSYVVAVSEGRADFFYADTGAAAGSVTGCPWVANQLRELRFAQLGDVMWVVHPAFWPIEIRRLSTNTWAQAPMVFDGPLGWPTYRYAAADITAQVGGGVASQITLAAAPTVGGATLAIIPGTRGQARLTAGPGPWCEFTVLSSASLVLGIAWTSAALEAGAGLDVQFDSSTAPGTGGTAGGGDGGGGASSGDAGGTGGAGAGPGSGDPGGPGDGGPGGPSGDSGSAGGGGDAM